MWSFFANEEWKNYCKKHEGESKRRIVGFQKALDRLTETPVPAMTLDELKKRLEIQLQIEDLIIKSGQAEHPHWVLYGSIAIGVLGAAIALLSVLFRR